MTDTPKHSVSVAGIVVNSHGRVLVIRRRDNGHWEPPGGVLEIGESFEDGVHREIVEETGFRVSVDRLTGVYKNMHRAVVPWCSGAARSTGSSSAPTTRQRRSAGSTMLRRPA